MRSLDASVFPGDKATTLVSKLSGGERALALALITRDAPHLLILMSQPTTSTWIPARRWFRRSNGYDGAVIIVSHDRHMIELTADRSGARRQRPARRNTPAASTITSTLCLEGVPLRQRSPSSSGTTARPRRGCEKIHASSEKAAADAEAASARLVAMLPHWTVRCSTPAMTD